MSNEASVQTGGEIDSWCTKCKMDLNHIVVAKVGEKVARVQCLTCNGEHAYRRPKSLGPAPKAKTSSAKTRKTTKSATVSSEAWRIALAGYEPQDLKAYNMRSEFVVGDRISHKKFGPGSVIELEGPSKMRVLFETGERTLVMNRS